MAVFQPNELKFDDKRFSMIVYGAPGVGKTTLACSAPKPVLIDFDRGVSRIRAQHRVPVIKIDSYDELSQDMQSDVFRNAESVIVDTGGSFITYLGDWAKKKNTAYKQSDGSLTQKGYGAIKAEFVRFTNELNTIHKKNIIYIFHCVEEKGKDGEIKQRLLCEGSSRNIVWQPCDLGAYMHMAGGKRVLSFTPSDEYFAKGCYGIRGDRDLPTLDDKAPNDFLTKLFDEARSSIALDGAYFDGEKKVYDAAIADGSAIIEAVTDIPALEAAGASIKSIKHALTSEIELRSALRDKMAELGIRWDKDAKKYVKKEG